MAAEWFPADQYKQALAHAITTARQFEGRFQIGLEKFSEYGKPGFRSGFLLPKPENRCGFELRCEAINASDTLPAIGKEHKAYSIDGRDGSERGTLTDVKV